MSEAAYLPVTFHGFADWTAAIEFEPLDSDLDGLWVRTVLTVGSFRVETSWFLASIIQRELASLHAGSAYGKALPQFTIADTDNSFELIITPTSTAAPAGVALKLQVCPAGQGPAITLLAHATARLSDIQSLLCRLSQFAS